MKVPANLRYTVEHVWLKVEGEQAAIGLTEFAQKELGDIVFIELPKKGEQVTRDASFGSIESVKTVSELIAPLNGIVAEVNQALLEKPDLLNSDPYEQGWMLVIDQIQNEELESLWSDERYKETYSE